MSTIVNRRVQALERQVARLDLELKETLSFGNELEGFVFELESTKQMLDDKLVQREAEIKKLSTAVEEFKTRDMALIHLDEKLTHQIEINGSLSLENNKLRSIIQYQRVTFNQMEKKLQEDLIVCKGQKPPTRPAPQVPQESPEPQKPPEPREPEPRKPRKPSLPPPPPNNRCSARNLSPPPPPSTPPPEDSNDPMEWSGTEEDEEDEENGDIAELQSSTHQTNATPTPSTKVDSPSANPNSQNESTHELKKKYRKEQKERLQASKNSFRRGSFFGASTLQSKLQHKKNSSASTRQEQDQDQKQKESKTRKRRNTRFGIYQAPRYHRASVVLDHFFGNKNKQIPKKNLAQTIHQEQGTKWGKKQRRQSMAFMGMQQARKAASTNPLTLAKSYLSMAGISKSWDQMFEKYSTGNATATPLVLELPQFKKMIREGCLIGKNSIPDFLLRRIFDLVDKDRLGEIGWVEFKSWLDDDGGAIKNLVSAHKMYDLSDSDDDEKETSEQKFTSASRRLSVQEREKMRLESIRLRMSLAIEHGIQDGTVRGWQSHFRAHDHRGTGKLELHTFSSTFRNKFHLSSDPELGGCTDRELRDVFFKVDKHHTGRIPIEPLLNWLFKGKHTPETNVKKSNAREGGRAAAALHRKESPLYNGRSTSDIRKFYSPTGVEIKGHHAMPQKTKSKQLGPSKKIVSRLYFDAGKKKRLLEEREKEKIKRQMEGCTFQPNVGPPPPAWTTEPTRMYDAGGDDMLEDTMNKEKGPAAAARRATMNLLYGV